MQLCKSEPLGIFDDHDSRRSDIESDLDYRCGDKQRCFSGGKGVHGVLLVGRRHAAMQKTNTNVAECSACQLFKGLLDVGEFGCIPGLGVRFDAGNNIIRTRRMVFDFFRDKAFHVVPR